MAVTRVQEQWVLAQVTDDWFARHLVTTAARSSWGQVDRRDVIVQAYGDLDNKVQAKFPQRASLPRLYFRWRPDDDTVLSSLERAWGRVTRRYKQMGIMENDRKNWSVNMEMLPEHLRNLGSAAKRDKIWKENCARDFQAYNQMVRSTLQEVAFGDPQATFNGDKEWPWQRALLELNHLNHFLEDIDKDRWGEIYGMIYDHGNFKVQDFDTALSHSEYRYGSRPNAPKYKWTAETYKSHVFELPQPQDILDRIKEGWKPDLSEDDDE